LRLHVVSGTLTFLPQTDNEGVHAETEIRFARPVRQVVAALTGFEVTSTEGGSHDTGALHVSLGVTQQQIPSKVAQIHGHLRRRGPGSFQGVIHFAALGVE
jgi:hypothetical protein